MSFILGLWNEVYLRKRKAVVQYRKRNIGFMKNSRNFLTILIVSLQEVLSFIWLLLKITESKRRLSVQPGYAKAGQRSERWKSFFVARFYYSLFTNSMRKRIGDVLCRYWLLKHVIERNIKGRRNVKGRWGRRRKLLLKDLKKKKGCRELKEAALDRTLWRTSFEEAVDLSQGRQ